MQTLLDVYYEHNGIDNDILFNPIKSVCTVFKPKSYKLYLPTVFIGSGALKLIKESKYLGFTFNDSKSDDCDMLRQMRLLYAKSNKLLRTFGHCSTDVNITLFQSYCTALYCPLCQCIHVYIIILLYLFICNMSLVLEIKLSYLTLSYLILT